MLFYSDINTCIVTTVSAVSNTLTWYAKLRLQLVLYVFMHDIYLYKKHTWVLSNSFVLIESAASSSLTL